MGLEPKKCQCEHPLVNGNFSVGFLNSNASFFGVERCRLFTGVQCGSSSRTEQCKGVCRGKSAILRCLGPQSLWAGPRQGFKTGAGRSAWVGWLRLQQGSLQAVGKAAPGLPSSYSLG